MPGLWIDQGQDDAGAVVLRVTGQLVGSWVNVLEQEFCRLDGVEGNPVVLDLSGLTFVGGAGACLLRRLSQRGARVTAAPQLILDVIGAEPPATP